MIKKKLAKKKRQNRPIPHWIHIRTDNTIRFSLFPASLSLILCLTLIVPIGYVCFLFQVQCKAQALAPYQAWILTEVFFVVLLSLLP